MYSVVRSLEQAFFSEAVQNGLTTMLLDSAESADGVRTYFEGRRENILSSLRDVVFEDDETEAIGMLPSLFLELRFEWNRYNAQIQYQTMLRGAASTELMLKSSAMMLLIEVVEAHLTADVAFWVSRIAADPIEAVSARGLTMGRLLSLAHDARLSQRMTFETLDNLGAGVAQTSRPSDLRTAIDRAKELMVTDSDRLVSLRCAELQDIFELLLAEKLKGRQIPVLLQAGNVDPERTLLPEVVTVLRSIVADWLDQLFEHSLEATVKERAASAKSHHLNLKWSLDLSDQRLRFELEDDGLGRKLRLPDVRGFSHLRLRCEGEFNAGRGRLSVVCEASTFSNFMLCSIERSVGPPILLAFFVNSVVSIMRPERQPTNWLQLLTRTDGTCLPIVELSQQWPNLDLAASGPHSQYLVLHTSTHGETAWRMDAIYGQVRGVILEHQTIVGPPELIGYLATPEGFALVIDSDQMSFSENSRTQPIERAQNAA